MRIHTVCQVTAVRIPKPTAPKKSGMYNCTADLALDCVYMLKVPFPTDGYVFLSKDSSHVLYWV